MTTSEKDLKPEDFETPSAYAQWARLMLKTYADASKECIDDAEAHIAEGLALREQALAILDRAKDISNDLARFLDTNSGTDVENDG